MRIRKQINKLSLRSNTKGKVQVFAPNKEMIAEKDKLEDAVNFAETNKDYKYKKKGRTKKEKASWDGIHDIE